MNVHSAVAQMATDFSSWAAEMSADLKLPAAPVFNDANLQVRAAPAAPAVQPGRYAPRHAPTNTAEHVEICKSRHTSRVVFQCPGVGGSIESLSASMFNRLYQRVATPA